MCYKHYIHKGLDQTTPLLKLEAPVKLNTEDMKMVFKGRTPEDLDSPRERPCEGNPSCSTLLWTKCQHFNN